MPHAIYRQVEPTNSGLARLDTPALLRAQEAYRRLLRQIRRDPLSAGTNAEANVAGYLAELDGALAVRSGVTA